MDDYRYELPDELIAHAPAEPRDTSRLMVYDTALDRVTLTTFADIARFLPARSLLVLNDTRVVPARLTLAKKTGGAVTILFLFNEWNGGEFIRGLPDKGVKEGDALYLKAEPAIKVISHKDEEFLFELLVSSERFRELIEEAGKTPLPPYIRSKMPEEEVRARYQTTFARGTGEAAASVAAPTASLHFTEGVFASLDARHIGRAFVTLHVGRGTFSPVTDAMRTEGKLHAEPVHVSAESARLIADAKCEGRPIIAAGTTALRALESAAPDILRGEAFDAETRLFIRPPYEFAIVDALITNFHLPGTSLIMLVDAFVQAKGARLPVGEHIRSWRDLYEMAVREQFRFYSFGNAMLIV